MGSSSFEVEDSDCIDSSIKGKSSTRQQKKRRRTRQQTREDEDDLDDTSLLELPFGEDYGLIDNAKAVICRDDWEEESYSSRVDELAPELVETSENELGIDVYKLSWDRLYGYQRQGCKWMHKLYSEGLGGILADEMGLGKTAQICVHFGSLGLMSANLYNVGAAAFLVVCPATVLQHWLNEFHQWAPLLRTCVLHAISSTGQEMTTLQSRDLESVLKKMRKNRRRSPAGIAVITTYGQMRRLSTSLSMIEWTAVCLDEGQKIRNHATKVSEVCKSLPSFHRLILSGTPIQNSLRELWSLFDFIYPGRLGTLPTFELELATPIRMGAYASASRLQRRVAYECAVTLQKIVQPFLLRRKKADVFTVGQLPSKVEQIIFCRLSPLQREAYEEVLRSEEVKKVLERKIPAFRAINTLRKLCNHPGLVYRNGRIIWQQDLSYLQRMRETGEVAGDDEEGLDLGVISQRLQWDVSGKLAVLGKILRLWREEGQKVLVFSQTSSMLSLLEIMVKEMKIPFLRLDGQTPVVSRARIVQEFNSNQEIFLMLLTTRTGGLGISLTSANRVVLFDPDWNPMTDIQARERAYRLGQQRDVLVYRLVCKGTIEEKIYERQIYKLLLSNRILSNAKEKALFSRTDLKDLFFLADDSRRDREQGALPEGGRVELEDLCEVAEDNLADPQRHLQLRLQEEAMAESDEEGGDGKDAVVRQDQLLLKTLFEGEAIASVYNHSFLEPDCGNNTANDEIEEEARALVQRAMSKVQRSAKGLYNSSAQTDNSAELNSNSYMAGNQFTTNSAVLEKPQLSSSSLLSRLRAKTKTANSNDDFTVTQHDRISNNGDTSSNNGRSKSNKESGAENSKPSLLVQYRSTSNNSIAHKARTRDDLETSAAALPMDQIIRNRLLGLYHRHNSASNSNKPSLPTNTILRHFSDLGDQYAPLFKTVLKSVASLKEGHWTLREQNA